MSDSNKGDSPATKGCGQREPLKLHDLMIDNVNTWGNVQYNFPLRLSSSETRTATSIGHREIPPVPFSRDCQIKDPLPVRATGRDMVVEKETYRTTSGEYCVKPNPNKAMERADCAINCRRVGFMTGVEKRLQRQSVKKPTLLSEMKDNYRGLARPSLAPPEVTVNPPDPEYIFDNVGMPVSSFPTIQVVAAGRAEETSIPESAPGYTRLMDPYFTTHRATYRPYSADQQIQCKDHITIYSESKTPKVKGFGPRHREVWMPLQSKRYKPVFDYIKLKKEYKEVAAAHNAIANIKGVFETETQRKFKIPFTVSSLSSWSNEETFDLAPFPPNPYQTNIAPFMYCSDYCHVSQGTPPCTVIDQFEHKLPAHKGCMERYIVSKDLGM